MLKTIIEVGANHGEDTLRMSENDKNRIFAFEPVPALYEVLQKKLGARDNVYILPAAVDVDPGWRWFNVSDFGSKGPSSLYDYNKQVAEAWHAEAFVHSARYKVMVVRLDSFMESNGIEEVDFLWIDAQGNDLRVLQSLGEKICCIKAGKCEVAFSGSLYEGAGNTFRAVSDWLVERGFETAMVPDGSLVEADLHFRRR